MSSFILYLLEASSVLAVLYALYWLFLSKETFFSLNRFFLLAILALSFLFPFLSFDVSPSVDHVIDKPVGELRNIRMAYYDVFEALPLEVSDNSTLAKTDNQPVREKANIWPLLLTIVLIIYGSGVVAVMFRLIWSYRWIRRLKKTSRQEVIHGLTVVKVSHQVVPFSFMNAVFVHQEAVQGEDFDQILAHEKTHIQERHSFDLLFVQLSAAFLWFNPVIWQLAKSLKTTHEYIADKKTIDQGYSLVTYQTLLLRQLISNNSYGLIHNFNLSFIKKRITMMNVKKSGWCGKAKVVAVLSAVVVFSLVLMQCNSKLDEQDLLDTQASTQEISTEIDVPVLPEWEFDFNLNPNSPTINLTVSENEITIDGEVIEADQIASVLEKISDKQTVILARIDRTQPMALVRDVHEEFRKANLLKMLYFGETPAGEEIKVAIHLPPYLGNAENIQVKIDDEYARENNMALLKIQMDEDNGPATQQEVYDFVKAQIANQNPNYVVSARFKDDVTYHAYLANVYYMQKSFYEIYNERAEEIYGEDFREIFRNRLTKDDYAKVYEAVKQGVPMAISIAED